MFGLIRRRISTSTIIIYYGIGMNQFFPERIKYFLINDVIEHVDNIDYRRHNIVSNQFKHVNNYYKPLKRHTKIF